MNVPTAVNEVTGAPGALVGTTAMGIHVTAVTQVPLMQIVQVITMYHVPPTVTMVTEQLMVTPVPEHEPLRLEAPAARLAGTIVPPPKLQFTVATTGALVPAANTPVMVPPRVRVWFVGTAVSPGLIVPPNCTIPPVTPGSAPAGGAGA
ncbi:MAG TPA: hypothetical protein VGO92_05555, partial [Acidimicrobiales bacterium]|nr:hypothetical protein [Acidimicrobiales bacterium]